jgi:hypothetical protein
VATTAGTTTISLDGAGAPGRTDWVVDMDYEDPSRADEHLVLPNSFSWGVPYELGSQAYAADGILWDAFFDLAGNDTFAEGHYAYNPDGTGLLPRLSRGNDGCELDQATVDIADLTFVRWYPGPIAPGVPDAGKAVYFGTGSTIRFAAPRTSPIAVSVWTYDRTGNVGGRQELQVAP